MSTEPPYGTPSGGAYYQPGPPVASYPPYPPASQPVAAPSVGPPIAVEQPKATSSTTTTIIINASGNCPKCLSGTIVETFTLAGICMAMWFFPCGLICCLRWKHRICDRCGAML